MKIDGRCHCGEISYEAEVDPDRVVLCHCTDCQTIFGGPYRANVPVRIEAFSLVGTPKTYVKVGDSGRSVTTAFCPTCGSSLFSQPAGGGYFNLRLGAVRQRAELPPKLQGFCGSAMPWGMDISGVRRAT